MGVDPGSQAIVAGDQHREHLPDTGDIHPIGNGNHIGHIVMNTVGIHLLQNEKPPLRRGEGIIIPLFNWLQRLVGLRALRADASGQSPDGGGLEQFRQRQLNGELFMDPRHQPHPLEGMAPQFKEVAVQPQLLGWNIKDFPPQAGEFFFTRSFRQYHSAGFLERRFRQRPPVHLAVGGDGDMVQRHKIGGNHVVRQLARQIVTQCLLTGIRMPDHIGAQIPLPRLAGPGQHHRLFHRRMPLQEILDLPRLHPEAANFHLGVRTPHIVNGSIGIPTGQIAAAIQYPRGQSGNRDITLGRQFRSVGIAPSHLLSTNVKFAGHTHWNWIQPLVQQIHGGVGQWFADGRQIRNTGSRGHGMGGGHMGFRRAVMIVKRNLPCVEKRPEFVIHHHLLPGGDNMPEARRRRLLEVWIMEHRFQIGHGKKQGPQSMLAHHRQQRRGIEPRFRRHQSQQAAGQQGGKNFLERHIETDGGELQDPVELEAGAVELESQKVHQVAMLQHHTFGCAGGSGGVDHVE